MAPLKKFAWAWPSSWEEEMAATPSLVWGAAGSDCLSNFREAAAERPSVEGVYAVAETMEAAVFDMVLIVERRG
jgi:hypothetical protein